jgi:hypothetical protein
MIMKVNRLILLFMIAIALCVGTASAYYTTQGAGETDKGPDGVMVPIGIPVQYVYLYTWFSLGFLFLIAGSAAQRGSEVIAFLLPLFASMFVWWGWLVMPIEQGMGIIIMSGMLALGVYFKGKQQEKFGIAGPGNQFLNIVFWMIVVQASIGFINATGLFGSNMNSSATPLQYQNVDLVTSVPSAASTGGFFDSLTSDLYLLGNGAWSAMTMLWSILMSIVWIKSLILSIAPFLSGVAVVDAFLTVISVAINVIIVIAIWVWLFKPGPGESI